MMYAHGGNDNDDETRHGNEWGNTMHGNGNGTGTIVIALMIAGACVAALLLPHVDTLMRAARVLALMVR